MNLHDILSYDTLSNIDAQTLFRVIVSIALGFLIGIERELTSKWAGLRTHILVCLGSTIFTILSIEAFPLIAGSDNVARLSDPARVAAQILTGIGFIGAGTVLRHGPSIYGLTTAATLWITASIGMAVGTGSYILATFTTLSTVLILTLVRQLEKVIINRHKKKYSKIRAIITCKSDSTQQIISYLSDNFKNITNITQKRPNNDNDLLKITAIFDEFSKNPVKSSYTKIQTLKNIETLSIKQIFDEL